MTAIYQQFSNSTTNLNYNKFSFCTKAAILEKRLNEHRILGFRRHKNWLLLRNFLVSLRKLKIVEKAHTKRSKNYQYFSDHQFHSCCFFQYFYLLMFSAFSVFSVLSAFSVRVLVFSSRPPELGANGALPHSLSW